MKSMTLYEISSEYMQALDALTDPEADIPLQAVLDTLEGIEGQLQEKAVNVAKFMRNLDVTVKAIKEAENQMAKRRKAIEKRVSGIQDYLKNNMEAAGITKIESPWFQLSIQKNPPAVEVENESLLPTGYVSVELTLPWEIYEQVCDRIGQHDIKVVKVDKVEIKNALKGGAVVPGAKLIQGTRLVIR